MAVRAGDAGLVHAALQERAVHVDLVSHLPVDEVEPVLEQREPVRVAERPAVLVLAVDLPTAGVAAGTGLELGAGVPAAVRCATGAP